MTVHTGRDYSNARRIATMATVSVCSDGGMSIQEINLRPDDGNGGEIVFADWGFSTAESIHEQALALMAGIVVERETLPLGQDSPRILDEQERVLQLVTEYVDAAHGPLSSPEERDDLIDEEMLYCILQAHDAVELHSPEIRIVTRELLKRSRLAQVHLVTLVRG